MQGVSEFLSIFKNLSTDKKRRKKTRCSGHTPCICCHQHGQACEYMSTTQTPRRTPRRGTGGRDSIPVPSPATTTISHESRVEETSVSFLSFLVASPHGSNGEVKESLPDVSLQEDQYGHVHGSSSEFTFLQFAKEKLDSVPPMSIDFRDCPLTALAGPSIMPRKQIADGLLRSSDLF